MRDNADQHRFELERKGLVTYADYRREGHRLVIPYVYAPPELRGTGAASDLMKDISDYAKENALEIVPICSYAATWVKRHTI